MLSSNCGERIIPLSNGETRSLAEKKLYAEKYEEIFGGVSEEDDDRVPIFICIFFK